MPALTLTPDLARKVRLGGHSAVLALFRNDIEGAGPTRGGDLPPATGSGSSLHHIALILPMNEQEAGAELLRQEGHYAKFENFL
ncbi:MAG: hypothetical protein RIE24_18520 [Silicimonas sp.]